MKKIKNLIFILILFCAISSVSYAKGTVSGSGTSGDPYQLVLGEGIIDIYYAEGKPRRSREISKFLF